MAEDRPPGMLKQTAAVAMGTIALVYHAVTRDGAIDAFLRQGANELGAVLGKAFPDSVQIDEPGTAFNPLYSDIAADKREHAEAMTRVSFSPLPSPSQIAMDGHATGSVHGDSQQAGNQPLRSPSEIASQPPTPPADHGNDHDRSQGRSM